MAEEDEEAAPPREWPRTPFSTARGRPLPIRRSRRVARSERERERERRVIIGKEITVKR